MDELTSLDVINFMLMRDYNALFSFLDKVDQSLMTRIFPTPYNQILRVFMRYYAKHGCIPSRRVYSQFKHDCVEYVELLNNYASTSEGSSDLKMVESQLYSDIPQEDVPFYREYIESYFLLNYDKVLQAISNDLYDNSEQLESETFAEITRLREDFQARLTQVLNKQKESDKLSFVMNSPVEVEDIKDAVPVETLFKSIWFAYMGITTLIANAKAYKTGINIALAMWAARQGFDVLLCDLENGLYEYKRRVLQSALQVPDVCIYSNTSVRKRLLKDTEFEEYDRYVFYNPGECVYVICCQKKLKAGKKVGFNSSNYDWGIKVRYFECVDPAHEKLTRSTSTLEYKGWEEITEVIVQDKHLYGDFAEDGEKALNAIAKDSGGQILIADMPNASASEMEHLIKKVVTTPFHLNAKYKDKQSMFYKNPETRLFFIDWILLMANNKKGKSDNIYLQTDDNYKLLKQMRSAYGITMFAIEGASDPKPLRRWKPKNEDVRTRGSTKAPFDVNHKTGLYATETELELGLRRLIPMNSRIASTTSSMYDYLAIYPDTQTIRILSPEEHKRLNPSDWGDEDTSDATKNKEKLHGMSMESLQDAIKDNDF